MRGRRTGRRVGPNHIYGANERQQKRLSAKLTQSELAKLTGFSERTIRTWEKGGAGPAINAAILVAVATKSGKTVLPVLKRPHSNRKAP